MRGSFHKCLVFNNMFRYVIMVQHGASLFEMSCDRRNGGSLNKIVLYGSSLGYASR